MNLNFPNLTTDQWQAIVALLTAKGLSLTGDQGTVEKFGAKVTYAFGNNMLAISVLSPPHFQSLASFTEEIRQFVEQAINS